MFKPVTSRLDTQIEATKKLNNKGLKELDPLPEFPIDEDEDEDEMPNYLPPPPINETQTEDEDEYEMPDFDPPPAIDEAQTEDEDEMPDFDLPPSIERKRKKWDTSADQKKLDRQRESLAEKRRQNTESMNSKKVKAKNGRLMEKSNCYICGKKKSKFIKGGALARYKGPSTVDKIAYVASNFVTPSPSFASMARLLAGQALKGVKDNVDYYKKGKAVVIERFNRTLKNKMYKQFTIQGNTQYLEMLPKIVKEYNNTKHSSIKMTPIEASKKKNEGTVYFNLYGDMEPLSAKPKFKVGDKVRISKYKRIVFDKGYTPNWSEEMFVITKIQHTNPITYKLKDLRNEDIQGSFYEPELLKAKQDVFRIDKVIRRDYKKKQALVKWKGYSDDFNSWIPMKDLQHI
ncbi:hypothetical protein ACROYT_G034722 [Oculina patagonica]